MWILAYTALALVLALCGWLYTIAPVIGVWMLAGIIGCFAYSLRRQAGSGERGDGPLRA